MEVRPQVKAMVTVYVPEWQIGQEVSVYFPDTMVIHSICEPAKESISYLMKGNKMVEFYRNDKNQVAVLVSRGYGSGFSTWHENKEIAYDSRVIQLWMDHPHKEEWCRHEISNPDEETIYIRQQLESFGYKDVWLGGWHQIELQWVDSDSFFRVSDYDGSEYIEILNIEKDYIYVPSKEDK